MSVSVKKAAYDHIREKLLTGQLAPGCHLSNRAMAEEIGASVIPIREAMSQLVSEGLLEHKPKVGTFVVETSRQEMLDLCELREALECYATLKAAKRMTEVELVEMEKCCHKMETIVEEVERDGWDAARRNHWRLADAGFHLALLRASGNKRASKTVSDLRVMTYVFCLRIPGKNSLTDPRRPCDEHRRIVEALREGDGATAQAVMSEHLARASKIVLAAYERQRRESSVEHAPSDSFTAILRQGIHHLEEEQSKDDGDGEGEGED